MQCKLNNIKICLRNVYIFYGKIICVTPLLNFRYINSNEQVELWGILLAIIVALSLLMWWCRTDESCCDVEDPCLYKFGCKKYKNDENSVGDEE